MPKNLPLDQAVLCLFACIANCQPTVAAEPTHTDCYEAKVKGIYEEIHPKIFVEKNLGLGLSNPGIGRWVETYVTGNVPGRVGLIRCKHCEQLRTGNSVDICTSSGNQRNSDRFNNWPVNYQLETRQPSIQSDIGNKTDFVSIK